MPIMTVEEMIEFAEGRITEDLMRKAQKYFRNFVRNARHGGRSIKFPDDPKRTYMRNYMRQWRQNKKGEGV